MSEAQQEVGRIARLMGRGRSESTPLHTSVLLVIAVVAGILVLVAFLVQQPA
jgi:hypothetical protein